ncbi:MAG: DUF58 domain-containing protein [Clostridiales bacterium]|nr:DUF58 domain-containing protein [Clostridiales bacterium]
MLIFKIVYTAALAFSGILMVFSDKYPFFVLFVLLLLFPLLGFAELILTCPFVRVKGRAADTIIENPEDNRIFLEIRSFMPVFNGILVLKLKNNLTGKEETQKVNFSALPFVTKKLTLKPVLKGCGVIEISLKKIIIRDFAKIFKFSKRPKLSFKQYIFPKKVPVDISAFLAKTGISLDEDKFSEEKSGHDPSEIFGIREYREGDSLRQIHYKLSAKRDKLISKEYSLPIDREITVICSPFFESLKDTDSFYNTVYSLSGELIKIGIKHTIIFKTKTNSITVRVEEERDLREMTCVLITLKPVIAESEAYGSLYIDGRNCHV